MECGVPGQPPESLPGPQAGLAASEQSRGDEVGATVALGGAARVEKP